MVMRRLLISCLVPLSLMVLASGPVRADITEFSAPMHKGHLLDWCYEWGNKCGAPAANAWCKTQGYDGAEAFKKWEDAGKSTRLIGTGQVCDEQMCDSFTMIACSKADAPGDDGDEEEETTYKKPKIKGVRLDWCRDWGVDCGKPAADAYCESRGDNKSVDFKIAENIGKTRIISTGKICNDPDCDGFKYITCK